MTVGPDFRSLPRIDGLVSAAPDLVARYGVGPVTAVLRATVERARAEVAAGHSAPSRAAILAAATEQLKAKHPGPPRRVINATGVIVHTNLGRAPLSDAAVAAVAQAAGYCDVEYDLTEGTRGKRAAWLEPLLTSLTGAEAGIVVNNAAAALVLVLGALAGGRQVVVSRGELVEIGGSFRLPEIMSAAGVELVEVGTTNRTRAADYLAGDDVALLLKVHPSNYRIAGFAHAPATAEIAAIAAQRNVPLLYDVGSGLLGPRPEPWFHDEPDVTTALSEGADLVVCSGDKLLGGPQAGLLVGAAELVAACAAHPLARAMRLDKLRLAALVATLDAHARDAAEELPVWSALLVTAGALRTRLEHLVAAIDGATIVDGASLIGGGAAPETTIATPVLRLPTASPDDIAAQLRAGDPPIIVRVVDGAITVDLRAVSPSDDAALAQRVASLIA